MIDPVGNNFFDLPEYEHTQDETFQPLPPPGSPGSAEDALLNGDPEGDQLPQSKDSSVTARRAVKRTIPKLDAQRPPGWPLLPHLHLWASQSTAATSAPPPAASPVLCFTLLSATSSPPFELPLCHVAQFAMPASASLCWVGLLDHWAFPEADLKTLIRHMEHWAHRLFPQLQFENVVDKIESLGNKKPVQACLKKIRLDLPLLNEDFGSNEGEDENRRLSPAAEESVFLPETQNTQNESDSPSLSPALTEEQQQRIERNRQRALERRQAKKQLSQSPNDELPTNEEYGTITTQEKDDICRDKTGVPFQATENMQSSIDQCF